MEKIMDSPLWMTAALILAVLVLIGWVSGHVLAIFLIAVFALSFVSNFRVALKEKSDK